MKLNEIKDNCGSGRCAKRVGRGRLRDRKNFRKWPQRSENQDLCFDQWFEGGQMPIHRRLPKARF